MKNVSSKRTKALSISKEVKAAVWERDEHRCIICGSSEASPNAHFIARSHGGLGIEENIVTLCQSCHHEFDFGADGFRLSVVIRKYLQSKYPYWNDNDLIYRKEL